jgi:hypothetical protein
MEILEEEENAVVPDLTGVILKSVAMVPNLTSVTLTLLCPFRVWMLL